MALTDGSSSTTILGRVAGTYPLATQTITAAVITTAATSTTPFGFATAAQADAVVALVNDLRTKLVALNIVKA